MTEQEEKQVSGEAQDTSVPTPEFSENLASSPSELSPHALEELLQKLTPVLEDKIDRKFKSTTDKRFSKLEKGLGSMTEVLAALKEKGATIPEEIEREYRLNDYIDARVAERTASVQNDNGMSDAQTKTDGQFDALAVVKSFGLDTNEAETLNLLKGKYRNPDHFQAEAAKLALKQAGKPAPSASSSPALTGGVSEQKLSAEEQEAKAKKLNALYKSPTANKAAIKSLEAELGWG